MAGGGSSRPASALVSLAVQRLGIGPQEIEWETNQGAPLKNHYPDGNENEKQSKYVTTEIVCPESLPNTVMKIEANAQDAHDPKR